MKLPAPEFEYRNLKFSELKTKRYRYLWWLLFWPIYWARYFIIEKLNPAEVYYPIHCGMDDAIPFVEWFIVPYMLWMVSMIALCLYTLRYDVESFKRYSKLLTVSMTVSTLIFLIFPSCQNLRPATMPRDNILTRCVELLYAADTNTNVFPSEHAIGAMIVWITSVHTKGLQSPLLVFAIGIFTLLVCASTVFLKQHSVLDVAAAIPICLFAWKVCEKRKG